jgi:hypothetical protein
VRILSTAFADIDTAIDSVNKGGVYRYVTKPWDVGDFEVTLRRAMEYFLLQAERDALIQQRIIGLEALALNDRVLSLAALATMRDTGLRHLGEALAGLSQLHAACSSANHESVPLHQLAWAELYKRHHAFLAKAAALLPKKLAASGELTHELPVRAAAVLASAAKGSKCKISDNASAEAHWPGPEAAVTERVKHLFNGIDAILADGEVVVAEGTASGVELHLPECAVLSALEPFFGSTAAPHGEASFALISAFLSFAHAGGTFEVQPDIGSTTVSLRIGFSPSRVNSPAGDSIEAIANDLIGNELFWYIFKGEPVARNGFVELSDDVPGLGLEIDEAALSRFKVTG